MFNVRGILKLKYPANWVFQTIQHNPGHNEPLRINWNDICIFLKIDMQWNIWISSQQLAYHTKRIYFLQKQTLARLFLITLNTKKKLEVKNSRVC